jgi:hypothetical protein
MATLDQTRFATGENSHAPYPDRRQINTPCTVEQFQKVKDEALRQGTTIADVMRQLIDLL